LTEKGVSALIKKIAIGSIVVILLISIFFISPSISVMQRAQAPSYDWTGSHPIDGEIGCAYEKKECESVRNLVLYNDTILDDSIEWNNPWYSVDNTAYLSSNGVTVEMGETPSGCAVTFEGHLSVPVVNYSRMTFNTSISVAKGNVTIHFYVYFKEWLHRHGIEGDYVKIEATAGEHHAISLSPPADSLLNLTTEWMACAEMRFLFVASDSCILNVGNVVVALESQEDLYPATFDVRDPTGQSIFENQYINHRGGEWRYYDFEDEIYPGFRLTKSDNYTYHSSTYIPRNTNETIYLPIGNYSGFIGWIAKDWMIEAFRTPCNFSIYENESISVTGRIPVHKLFLNMQPLFPYTSVTVQDYISIWITSDEQFLYLYPSSQLRVYLFPMSYSNFGVEEVHQYDNRIHLAYILIPDIEMSSVINLNVRYSHLAVGSFVLDYGNLLWLLSCCLLGVIILVKLFLISSQPGFKRRLVPTVPLILSMLFPWVQFEISEGTTTILSSIFVPFTATLWSGGNGTISFVPTSFLILSPLIVGLVFWLPLAVFLSSPLILSKIEDLRLFGAGTKTDKFLILIGPVILAVYYLAICITNGFQIGLGLLAAFAYPLVFLISYYWSDKKKRSELESSDS